MILGDVGLLYLDASVVWNKMSMEAHQLINLKKTAFIVSYFVISIFYTQLFSIFIDINISLLLHGLHLVHTCRLGLIQLV